MGGCLASTYMLWSVKAVVLPVQSTAAHLEVLVPVMIMVVPVIEKPVTQAFRDRRA